jgi:hypothetical protein
MLLYESGRASNCCWNSDLHGDNFADGSDAGRKFGVVTGGARI